MGRTQKPRAKKPRLEPPKKAIRINTANLTEDDADYVFYLKHRQEKREAMDDVLKKAGYDVDR